jgi:hypothetical protein
MDKAKCKLCRTVIDLNKDNNCSCGEIGCDSQGRLFFRDISNFVPIDDQGNSLVLNVVKEPERKEPTFEELLSELNILLSKIEEMPPQAMTTAVTHFDLYSALVLIAAILRKVRP